VIRAFIAVALEPLVIAKITGVIDELKPHISGVRWVPPGNLHLTLKFLGNIDEALVAPIGAALHDHLRLFPRCTINAKGLGVFPGLKRPRVLWVGLVGSQLVFLASKVESALLPLGFARETRKFTPHLTIGRWRDLERAPQSLVRQLDQWRAHDFGVSKITNVKLMQSVLNPEGASYSELTEVPLTHEPSA
jgi:RNA 2',3'-cyclic 3'-phosphodiesterase